MEVDSLAALFPVEPHRRRVTYEMNLVPAFRELDPQFSANNAASTV
jgi:hypothetical protein